MSNKKVAVYTRVTSVGQENNRVVEEQKIALKKFAKKNNYIITNIYEDVGYSGNNFSRPGLLKLLEDIRNKKINILILSDLNRISRNLGYNTFFLAELKKFGVEAIIAN